MSRYKIYTDPLGVHYTRVQVIEGIEYLNFELISGFILTFLETVWPAICPLGESLRTQAFMMRSKYLNVLCLKDSLWVYSDSEKLYSCARNCKDSGATLGSLQV